VLAAGWGRRRLVSAIRKSGHRRLPLHRPVGREAPPCSRAPGPRARRDPLRRDLSVVRAPRRCASGPRRPRRGSSPEAERNPAVQTLHDSQIPDSQRSGTCLSAGAGGGREPARGGSESREHVRAQERPLGLKGTEWLAGTLAGSTKCRRVPA
jgi:hypothetical protein